MPYYIQFSATGLQESALLSDKKPNESGWYPAPEAYDGSRLCVLDNNQARLMTDKEIATEQHQQQRVQTLDNANYLADSIRGDVVKGTSAIKREGYQVKANISIVYRLETALKKANALPKNETLLNQHEQAAIQTEIKERGFGETSAELLAIWEKRAGEYAIPICNISGVETRINADISAASPEELEQLSKNLNQIAAQKRAAFKAQQEAFKNDSK